MPHESGRYLAPLALLACVIAVLVVVTTSTGGDEAPTSGSAGEQAAATATATNPSGSSTSTSTTSTQSAETRTYTVKSGDTLAAIAEQTGTSVEEILRLNEGVDPQQLRTGQKLKLAE
jgi:LysM repeat protein